MSDSTSNCQKTTGEIKIQTIGMSIVEIEKLRSNIETLMVNGAFNVKQGRTVLHWDSAGRIAGIDFDFKGWRKKLDNEFKKLYN